MHNAARFCSAWSWKNQKNVWISLWHFSSCTCWLVLFTRYVCTPCTKYPSFFSLAVPGKALHSCLFFTVFTQRFPNTLLWWVIHLVGLTFMVLLGTYPPVCLMRALWKILDFFITPNKWRYHFRRASLCPEWAEGYTSLCVGDKQWDGRMMIMIMRDNVTDRRANELGQGKKQRRGDNGLVILRAKA